ncbi:hypothetical protein GDO86_017219 [Hymenochirus boettgeri]|uniref:DNA-3-methyladenine glycosylase n=1 Tax=Hymenochirus boettgeri TaxID=247094 RepID=A0A8T2IJE3_9PIPI|nr:hypothetical protein GDO86_017219 [Hymenochirus boettgeri]
MTTKRRHVHALSDTQCKPVLKKNREPETSLLTEEHNANISKYFQSVRVRLRSDFYNQACIELAKSFLGQVLVRMLPDGTELCGRIVETEAYLGGDDEASHSRGGKRTKRNVAMYMTAGTVYVYQIYGIYFCMNVSSQGDGAAVLLRSLEPLEGLDVMRKFRNVRRRDLSKSLKHAELCNGPSKLCQALNLDKNYDRKDLSDGQDIWMEAGKKIQEEDIVSCARIGIANAGEWTKKPLRFYIKGNKYVSVRDKSAEASMISVLPRVF